MSVIPIVIQQHAEEAAILWQRRAHAIGEPHYSLAQLDDQLEAHIDGLRIAGDDEWEICQGELSWEEPGEVFAAGVLALESGDPSRIDKVPELGCSAPELERGLISALGWTDSANAPDQLVPLMAASEPARRRAGIATCAIRREDPGAPLAQLLAKTNRRVRARALKAAAELGRIDLSPRITQAMSGADAPVVTHILFILDRWAGRPFMAVFRRRRC